MPKQKEQARRILVFDSGVGGLTVARALLAGRAAPARSPSRPPKGYAGHGCPGGGAGHQHASACVRVDYAADFAGFPYGDWAEEALREHLLALMERLLRLSAADVVVIACNTASTLALEALRAAFPDIPFVGTVPAIKPAAQVSASGIIGVLATPGTVRREYTERLIHTFAWHRRVVLHGAQGLAALAERKLRSETLDMAALRAEIAPAFVQGADGARTDVVVLGCTHYPLLLEELEQAAPWPVRFIDPSAAIARQALRVAGLAEDDTGGATGGRAFITGVAAGWSSGELRRMFAREGFAELVMLDAGGGVA